MSSDTKTFRQQVLTANRDELLDIAYDTWSDSDLCARDLIGYLVCVAYNWRLDETTGTGRQQTADEIRADLLEEFGDYDDDADAPTDQSRHYCDVADAVVRARRVAEWFGLPWHEPFPSLFAEPVQLNLFTD